jgi:charged multivesicular body protein 2A
MSASKAFTDSIQLGETPSGLQKAAVPEGRVAQAIGGPDPDDDDLQARLDSLRR